MCNLSASRKLCLCLLIILVTFAKWFSPNLFLCMELYVGNSSDLRCSSEICSFSLWYCPIPSLDWWVESPKLFTKVYAPIVKDIILKLRCRSSLGSFPHRCFWSWETSHRPSTVGCGIAERTYVGNMTYLFLVRRKWIFIFSCLTHVDIHYVIFLRHVEDFFLIYAKFSTN